MSMSHRVRITVFVSMYHKVQCMRNGSIPTTIKTLKGFLGLTGYYGKFIKGYGLISKPLTTLLKKDGFLWNKEAKDAFNHLKEVMSTAPVLSLIDFTKPFVVETNACGKGIGVVIMQEGSPIAYLSQLQASYEGDTLFQSIVQAKVLDAQSHPEYKYDSGVLKEGNKIYVGSHGGIREKIIKTMHDSALGGHSGINGTLQGLRILFYWSAIKEEVHTWVKDCETFQRAKNENNVYPGLLQPLPIPEQAWSYISMDFIEGLPKSDGKDAILVFVDRLTKYSHFIAIKHPYTAISIAKIFFDNIYKSHGLLFETAT
ncbi:Retrovirus-related Pol polyprotein from transposon.6 [Sesamum angolense]|uniref:Retrovirus-related Pol polyprotein from transposon.6 n=1 Tax=Sesamum angolense TaxID=2727404 RepID=A0AAE2BN49_9LAMI|nr:Retrovirus-related Pol polyprotein from transposon.6 [Sesamum angolense]